MGTTAMDISDIKWLREETGAGVMEAKKALQESGGDRDKAKKLLQQRGLAKAAANTRATAQGIVESYIHAGGQIGVLVELDSETDFVSRMPEFKELAHQIALQVAAMNPQYLSIEDFPEQEAEEMKARFREEAIKAGKEKMASNIAEGQFKKYAKSVALLEQEFVQDPSKTIKDLVHDLSARTRENIVVKRFARYQVGA